MSTSLIRLMTFTIGHEPASIAPLVMLVTQQNICTDFFFLSFFHLVPKGGVTTWLCVYVCDTWVIADLKPGSCHGYLLMISFSLRALKCFSAKMNFQATECILTSFLPHCNILEFNIESITMGGTYSNLFLSIIT